MQENQIHERRRQGAAEHTAELMLIDVLVQTPHRDCPVYTWDRELDSLRLLEIHHAKPGLPADLAIYRAEGEEELPVLLLSSFSVPPHTRVQARLLGGLSCIPAALHNDTRPADGWIFVAAAQADASYAPYSSIEALPPAQRTALQIYASEQAQKQLQVDGHDGLMHPLGAAITCDAGAAARILREMRVFIKRERRGRAKGRTWIGREEEEKPVAWRAVEGLSQALRLELQRNSLLAQGENAPHAQADQLIRLAPSRFQHALAKLLLDDERLLAFIERPLLQHRTGLLGMQAWRSNEGLFVLTDRQALWLRDFLAPGNAFIEGGYIARVIPLERLQSIAMLPAGKTSGAFADRLEIKDSPYQRLVLETASATGEELIAIEFPARAEVEKALAHISSMMRAFLPLADGEHDRRVRRLPTVEMWVPQGAEAERLAGLGGIVPIPVAQRLEQQLASSIAETGEEALVSALVPALEGYKSPARLVALTHCALLIVEDGEQRRRASGHANRSGARVRRYDIRSITSAQLHYSLMGSGLNISIPNARGSEPQHIALPFHSPAIAWFLPMFTRLRLLLSEPYRQRNEL